MQLLRIRICGSCLLLTLLLHGSLAAESETETQSENLSESVIETLDRAIRSFRTLAIRGGYVHRYNLSTGQKWGEGPTDDQTIEVQPPGTPTVGMAFLRAFKATGSRPYLEAAEEAARALIMGQNDLGGWEHTIQFDRPKRLLVSFDDDQTQSAIRFLIALDQESGFPGLRESIERALQMMLESQFENGAWPHRYPRQGNYHDFATFNDGGINDCIQVMLDAHRLYGRDEHLRSLHLAGSFLLLSQLPTLQPGWAQQYNQYLQPAWARSFEPPSVCTLVTLRNVNTLLDLALYTRDNRYLEPIPDAIAWLGRSQLPNGLWPRFVELGTNQPLYYDRGRIRVNSVGELQEERRTGYNYEKDISVELTQSRERFKRVQQVLENGLPLEAASVPPLDVPESTIRRIISEQDEKGWWFGQRVQEKDRRKPGEDRKRFRISSRLFVENLNMLCAYLEQHR